MTEPNVLFLDEPTNDLDIQTLGILEEYLDHFPGVVITVSHDRYFLDRVVDKLLVFSGGGEVQPFYGNYSDYLAENRVKDVKENKPVQQEQKPKKQKKKLSYLEQKEWDGIEDQITQLEEKIEQLQSAIIDAGSDSEKVQHLFSEQQEVETELERKMERWEELSLMIEEYEGNS